MDAFFITVAKMVVDGMPLGKVFDVLGVEDALIVHELTITRPFQHVGWKRRIR